jgi:hypothetical protein
VIPVAADLKSPTTLPSEIWNGEYYANFGDGPSRSWADAVRYGFISAGGVYENEQTPQPLAIAFG